jgi:D-glycero-D-manno-heptose 1,7-bisphosphate phosphatase
VAERLTPAVFIDRDGTVMQDVDYCADANEVAVFPGAGKALQSLQEAGFKIIIITNQSGIGRGYFDEAAYRLVEKEVVRQLAPAMIAATYFCPHAPEEPCSCRKPSPGMVQQAAVDHAVDLTRSFFIGDKPADVECGRRAGTRTILAQTGYGRAAGNDVRADHIAPDLADAAAWILQQVKK